MEEIYLTQEQIDVIRAFFERGPNDQGRYDDTYMAIAEMLPDGDVKLWFEGAAQANAGQGAFSAVIRAYSRRQMELRGISYSDSLMQEASNTVAVNALTDILSPARLQPDGTYLFPTIEDIANNDAVGVGQTLFAALGDDTAGGLTNAAWSGTILFSALGSNQTYRLTSGAGGSGLDRIDDFKNILYAYESYRVGLSAAIDATGSQITSFDSQFWADLGIGIDTLLSASFDDLWSLAWGNIGGLMNGDARFFAEILQEAGPAVAIDWLRSSYQSENLSGSTQEDNFATVAMDFFNGFSNSEQQSIVARLLPGNKQQIVAMASADEAVRNALYSLSPIAVERSSYSVDLSLLDPETGEGAISDKWIDKRTSFLVIERLYRQDGQSDGVFNMPLGLPVPIIGDIIFQDHSGSNMYQLEVDGVDGGIAETKRILFGGESSDTLNGGDGEDFLFGMDGNDQLNGGEADDYIEGGAGADTLNAGAGNDDIFGGRDNDEINGDDGDDRIDGGNGNDQISGGAGDDRMIGGRGDDNIAGDDGSDIVAGGEGSDTLTGGEGVDALGGGAFYDEENDTYWLRDDNSEDRLEGGNGYDYYFVDTLDIINDSDGQGRVYFQSAAQGNAAGNEGGLWWSLGSAYETAYNSGIYEARSWGTGETFTYALNGSTLSINGEVSIENYEDGDLGIRLYDRSPPPDPQLPTPPPTPASPIILDLDGDGIETLGLDAGVHFDLDNSGFNELTGWVGSDDGLLVYDLNANGNIDNGSELFGNYTQLQSGGLAEHGFVALSDLDTSNDGAISHLDAAFEELRVWRDSDSNSRVDDGELFSLSQLNIAEIKLDYSNSDFVDNAGNHQAQISSYTLENGIERAMADVWFTRDTQQSENGENGETPPEIAALPDIQGTGNVQSLHAAMAQDSELQDLVEAFIAAPSQQDKNTLLEDILFRWVGENGGYEQHNQSLIDRRRIHTLEAFYGYELPDPRGGGWQYTELYERLFQQFTSSIYSQLAGQTHLKDYRDAIIYTTEGNSEAFFLFDNLIEKLLYDLKDLTPEQGEQLLNDIYQLVDGLNPYEGTSFSNEEGEAITGFKDQIREFIGTDVIDTLFDGYLGNIEPELEVGLRRAADLLLSVSSGATQHADNITGSDEADRLSGLSGNDVINGLDGDDVITGGRGNDRLLGGLGSDEYHYSTGDGDDSISNNSVDGSSDTLHIHGVTEESLVLRRQGDDLLVSFEGNEGSIRVEAQFLNDGVNTNYISEIVLDGGARIDARAGNFNIVNQVITQGDDAYHGSVANDTLDLLGGDDALYGKAGDDTLSGGDGHDRIFGDEGNDTLNGDDGHDFLYGGDGQDVINGGLGNDILRGNAGDDRYTINQGDGIDALLDDEGNNVVELGTGITLDNIQVSRSDKDLIIDFIGRPEDQVSLSEFFNGNTYSNHWNLLFADNTLLNSDQIAQLSLQGTENNDQIQGLYTDNVINGLAGNDSIDGNRFDDVITGGQGRDTLRGDRGSDIYHFNLGDGQDNIRDLAGEGETNSLVLGEGISLENLKFRKRSDGLAISIIGAEDSVLIERYFQQDGAYQLVIQLHDGSVISYADILGAILVATEQDDVIYATDENNTINLLNGDDDAFGEDGNDQISGGAGNDNISGGDGDDQLYGDEGQDNLSGNAGSDQLFGGAGNDALNGGTGNDTLQAGAGADILRGDTGDDRLMGGAGDDTLHGGYGDDELTAGEGDDSLYGGRGNDTYVLANIAGTNTINNNDVSGDQSTDRIRFASDVLPSQVALSRVGQDLHIQLALGETVVSNFFHLDATDNRYLIDSLVFEDGTQWSVEDVKARVILGNSNDQTLLGYAGDDQINAAAGNDLVFGAAGDDELNGDSGDDQLFGETGSDQLSGGAGKDNLFGGEGNDVLAGGQGNDQLEGGQGDDNYIYNAGDGEDTLSDSSGNDAIALHGYADGDLIFRRQGNDLIIIDRAEEAARQNSEAEGEARALLRVNDHFSVGDSAPQGAIESITVGGLAAIDFNGLLTAALNGTNLDDDIQGHGIADSISALEGDDLVYAGAGNDTVEGGLGDDRLYGESGDDSLNGGLGNDTLDDYTGNNTLRGEQGDDTISGTGNLYGGEGNDSLQGTGVLSGGDGNDIIVGSGQLHGGAGADELRGQGSLYGDSGDDLLVGSESSDQLFGGDGNDTLYATDGESWPDTSVQNLLEGGAGNDQMFGSFSADTYRYNLGDGHDQIVETQYNDDDVYPGVATTEDVLEFGDGISASDLSYTRTGLDLIISVNNGTGSITVQNWFYPYSNNADLFKINRLRFTTGEELTHVDIENQVIYQGSDGDDTLFGYYDRNETIDGGAGNDYIDGADGDDVLIGNEGDDQLQGRAGSDIYDGGTGDDKYVYHAAGGHDIVRQTGGGFDGLFFQVAADQLTFSREGDNLLIVVDGDAEQTVTVENHFLGGDAAIDYVQPASGNYLTTQDIANIMAGDNSEGDYDQVVTGTENAEQLGGSNNRDQIIGLGGDDQLFGFGGADLLQGGDGNDYLAGGGGQGTESDDDILEGGLGNDTLYGEGGNDFLVGGAGDDNYYYDENSGVDTIDNSGGGNDYLVFRDIAINRLAYFRDGDDLIVRVDDDAAQEVRVQSHFLGGEHRLEFLVDGSLAVTPVANVESQVTDYPGGSNGGDSGGGDSGGGDTGGGDTGGGQINPNDYDQVVNASSNQTLGSNARDYINGWDQDDQVFGFAGDDYMAGNAGNDYLSGGNGSYNGSGDDILDGGAGNDILVGEDGNDFLFGGEGNDHYYIRSNNGIDEISDSSGSQDVLFFNDVARERLHWYRQGDNLLVRIDDDPAQQVTVNNHFLGGDYGIELVQPGDGGFSISAAQIESLVQDIPTVTSQSSISDSVDALASAIAVSDDSTDTDGFVPVGASRNNHYHALV